MCQTLPYIIYCRIVNINSDSNIYMTKNAFRTASFRSWENNITTWWQWWWSGLWVPQQGYHSNGIRDVVQLGTDRAKCLRPSSEWRQKEIHWISLESEHIWSYEKQFCWETWGRKHHNPISMVRNKCTVAQAADIRGAGWAEL